MMTRLALGLAIPFTVLISAPAFAQAKVKVRKKDAAAEAGADRDEGASRGGTTSAERRRTKTAAFFGEIGLTFSPMAGVRGEYLLDPQNVVVASYLRTESIDVLFYKYSKTLVDLRYKRFLTNSLYFDGGLGIETFRVRYDVALAGTSGFGRPSKTLTGTATNIGAEIHLGNEWQWSAFALGCDWVGYFAALSKTFSAGSADGVDPADKADGESDVKGNLNAGSAQVVRLYVGWSF